MGDKLRRVKAYRNTCLSEIHSLRNIANNAKTNASLHGQLKVRFADIDNIRDEFMRQHNALLDKILGDNTDVELAAEDAVRIGFLDVYYETKTLYNDIFGIDLNATTTSLGTAVSASSAPRIKLPQIELKLFEGDFTSFPTYIGLFDSLIHNNISLSTEEKFSYLLSSLRGAPLRLVQHYQFEAVHYQTAYDSLVKRYSNTRLRAKCHWQRIEQAEKIKSKHPQALRTLLDTFQENLSALKNLDFPVSEWDFIVQSMLFDRLDDELISRFEHSFGSSDVPKYNDLVCFLEKQCVAFDMLHPRAEVLHTQKRDNHMVSSRQQQKTFGPKVTNFFADSKESSRATMKCVYCKGCHLLYKCSAFQSKSPFERYNFSKKAHVCFNCLSSVHDLRSCKSTSTCTICSQRHHTLLHFKKSDTPNNSVDPCGSDNLPSTCTPENSSSNTFAGTGLFSEQGNILLSTALVEVLDAKGNYQILRCLLDSGSMSTFVSKRAITRLGLSVEKCFITVKGLDSSKSCTGKGIVTITIRSLYHNSSKFYSNAVVIDKICEPLPTFNVSQTLSSRFSNLKLADPKFFTPSNIDLLLGADLFAKVISEGRVLGQVNEPDAMNTVFGYVLMGKVGREIPGKLCSFFCDISLCSQDSHLEDTLKKFWEIESVPNANIIAPKDSACEKLFMDTYTRDSEGRYIVHLPFSEEVPNFPGIRDIALQRFFSLERRLRKNPALYEDYSNFMKDYLMSDHMELVPKPELSRCSYYIPHHCVLKPSSTSTKLRVVFNASCRASNNSSLNDKLLTGPKLQKNIVTILLNFRLHRYVLCADIKQMYRMILLEPKHQDYQRIFWRFSPKEPVEEYRLKTVTYGVSSSPFLALRVLQQLVTDEGASFPLAAQAILNETYIDDIVTGSATLEQTHVLQSQLIELLQLGGFELRKWSSNDPSLLNHLPDSFCTTKALSFDSQSENESLKVLGLCWNPVNDAFSFSVEGFENRSCTKRHLLSELARIYDPLGFLTPVVFLLKHLIQRLWIAGLDWDSQPPEDIVRLWNQYKFQFSSLTALQIQRRITSDTGCTYELHGFCDSSEKGYAAVVYLRTLSWDKIVSSDFVCAKSKVAPLKRISIPRLELCAAVLLARLMSFVHTTLKKKLNLEKLYTWSDSQVVLAWIRGSPHRWKTFVANRVTFLQEILPTTKWLYVESGYNPADIGSRGLLPNLLVSNEIWFHGPEFLAKSGDLSEGYFSHCQTQPSESSLLAEMKITSLSAHLNPSAITQRKSCLDYLLDAHSDFRVIQRVLAWVLRFINNCRKPDERRGGSLISVELYSSVCALAKHTQYIAFSDEINSGRFSKPLRKLNVFFDDQEILRVGGRLKNSNLRYESKHPILLPRSSRLTTLLIEYYHRLYLHIGQRGVQFLISQQFWVLSPKRAIHSVLSKCISCWRLNPKPYEPPLMGNLPISRVSQLKPFSHSGTDYGGPFLISLGKRFRGCKTTKAYICVFVCHATKAVHIELVGDLTTDSFLSCLQRFISRRGRCSHLYSDNGTNFVGANKKLNELMRAAASREGIQWHFNPPSAPHFGGLFESVIKSVKTHLARVVGDQVLTYEEFYTLLTLIESILNSRPLCAMSSDPEDIHSLTPGHFLTLEPLTPLAVPDLTCIPLNRLSRWQMLQRMHQDYWARFHKEYLHSLQQRSKWTDSNESPKVGTLVVIKRDDMAPSHWTLGRIMSLSPGSDGVTRVARVRTANGVLLRPLVKLCPLPME